MNKNKFFIGLINGLLISMFIFCLFSVFFLGVKCYKSRNCNGSGCFVEDVSSVQYLRPSDVSSSSFAGSNFSLPVSFYADSSTSYLVGTYSFFFDFTLNSDYTFNFSRGVLGDSLYGVSHWTNLSLSSSGRSWHRSWQIADVSSYGKTYFQFAYTFSSSFNFNVVRIEVGTFTDYFGDSAYRGSYIIYSDSNGEEVGFVFRIVGNLNPNYYLSSRYYYLTGDLSSNDYYNQGYLDGYSSGDVAGQSTGYNNGYSAGQSVGYNNGYNAGVSASNQYTFSSLLTAVIDAPVHVFIDMLNFDIMGYNLLNLVVGLLTFAIIVLILKLILGGK